MTTLYTEADIVSADAMLERLSADHRRFSGLLDALQEAAENLREGDQSVPAKSAHEFLASLHEYVRGGHHLAEETLFDAVAGDRLSPAAEDAIVRLRRDHGRLEGRAEVVLYGLERLVSGAPVNEPLLYRLADFCQYEREHLRTEQDHVFPELARQLAGDGWDAVRQELASRLFSRGA